MRVAAADIDALGRDDIVLVGHSMAGLAIAGVIDLVHARLRHVALVSCVVPPHGQSLLDMLPPEIRAIAEAGEPTPGGVALDEASIRAMQCADMSEEQAAFTVSVVVPEAYWPIREPVDLTGFERLVPLTWIELRDDQTFPPEMQQEMAKRAKSTATIPLASGHVAMISHPEDLAAALNSIHRAAFA